MKKTQFLLYWLAIAPVALGMYFAMAHLTSRGSVWDTAETYETSRLLVSKHPDADLCVLHHPKVGRLPIVIVAMVHCDVVRDRLSTENPEYGSRALGDLIFLRAKEIDGFCVAAGAQEPNIFPVDCALVEHLLEGERYCRVVD